MRVLRLGSTGPLVEFLQNILNRLEFYNENINGIFDNSTKNAVINFQHSSNLIDDGIVGPNTWRALSPYINRALGFIVPTNIRYSSSILNLNITSLKSAYPFLEVTSSGKSVLGTDIPVIKIGQGSKEIFYSGAIHRKWVAHIPYSYEIFGKLLLLLC